MAKQAKGPPSTVRLRGIWAKRIAQSTKDYDTLHTSGKKVVDTYRIEARSTTQQDKYNILYSITETIKPSMYSQTPKPQVKRRHTDRTSPIAIGASLLLESAVQYTIEDQDFDEVMRSAVEDFLLPGIGTCWVRYQPSFKSVAVTDAEGMPTKDEKNNPITRDVVSYEKVAVDLVLWKDFLTGRCRNWGENTWVGRRLYLDKQSMLDQGIDPVVVGKISFRETGTRASILDDQTVPDGQVAVWEIWDKTTRSVIWYSDAYSDGLIKVTDDFLKLEGFFPTPRPMRAVTTNNKFVPRPFYSQYQAQADELNEITARIRKLVKAVKVVGVYDQSVPALQNLMTGNDNRMIPVDNWAVMAEKGGIKGTMDFMPIKDIAAVLLQMYDARERVKAEIYEITGWSDIIRGVSKASETLGAQQIKAEWAGARLKLLQKDVQRFVRDVFRLIGEIVSEHFSVPMLALMAGLEPDEIAQNPQLAANFQKVVETIRNEKERCALIGIETDSTLMPDEANDRKDRMEFVSAAGAFLQQAVPAMEQMPAMGPLLGEILMFAVRSFRSARPLEETFEKFRQQIESTPPQPKAKEGGDSGQGAVQTATINAQTKAQDSNLKFQLGQQANAIDAQGLDLERQKETNRHNERMAEITLKAKELGIDERELVQKDQHRVLDQIDSERDRLDAAETSQADRDHAERIAAADRAVATPPGGPEGLGG